MKLFKTFAIVASALCLTAMIGCSNDEDELQSPLLPPSPSFNEELTTTSSLTVEWEAVEDAASYTVKWWKEDDDDDPFEISVSGTSYTLSGLESETTYCVQVKACSAAGEEFDSSYSSTISYTTLAETGDEPEPKDPDDEEPNDEEPDDEEPDDEEPEPEFDTINIKLVEATSSTITIEWDVNGEHDFSKIFNAGLWTNATRSNLWVIWTINILSEWSGDYPYNRFTFTGLDAGTTYYARVEWADDVTLHSDTIGITTPTFDYTVSTNAEAQVGDVLVAEDFYGLIHGGDLARRALGISDDKGSTARTTWAVPKGENPYSSGMPKAASTEWNLFTAAGSDEYIVATGLDDWCTGSDTNTSTRPGYIKIGGASNYGYLATPVLSTIPEGKVATVKVDFTAMGYANATTNSCNNVCVAVVDNAVVSNHLTTGWTTTSDSAVPVDSQIVDITSANGLNMEFKDFSTTLTGVSNVSRIRISSDTSISASSNLTRFYLDNVVVTVTDLEDKEEPDVPEEGSQLEVAVSNVRAGLGWVNVTLTNPGVDCTFSVYDGTSLLSGCEAEFIKDNGNGTSEYSISGLALETTYSSLSIVAEAAGYTASEPAAIDSFTTGNIYELTRYPAPTNLSFEWDDSAAGKNWVHPSSADGEALDRTFWLQLATDANFNNLVYDLATVSDLNTGTYVTSNWNGSTGDGTKAGSSPHLYAFTTVCFGNLQPNTTYYFRVRNAAGETYASTTLAAANGKSAWSPAISATTTSSHVSSSDELLFQGFDDHCFAYDHLNNASGIVPIGSSTWTVGGSHTYGVEDLGSGHRYDQIGATVSSGYAGVSSSAQFPYTSDGLIDGCNELRLIKDDVFPSMNGWHVSKATYPMQGSLRLGAATSSSSPQNNVIVSPPFNDLTEATNVTISCDAASCHVCNQVAKLRFFIFRTDTQTLEAVTNAITTPVCPVEVNPNGENTFRPYPEFETYSCEATLNPGDYVVWECLTDGEAGRILFDNLSVVKR